ncbi:hypothetical protein KUL42_18430 [Alteromonas sp. KUL42]|nr:hypothetical protein KUL42_18430 [Alteromonas sp. KUL42]
MREPIELPARNNADIKKIKQQNSILLILLKLFLSQIKQKITAKDNIVPKSVFILKIALTFCSGQISEPTKNLPKTLAD